MSAFKLYTLKQKLWAIVAASLVTRVIMFFVLPNTPSSWAPDEGTYASLAKWISESKPAKDFPSFGEEVYLSSRSVIIPASTLIKFGMNELDAVRGTSSIYGFLALCLLAYLCSKLQSSNVSGVGKDKKLEGLVVTLLLVYAFLPSHFVWSNLGLRESPNEFWLIMAFIGVFLLYKEGQSKKPLFAVSVFISIICTFSSRPQVGWVLVATLLVYSLYRIKTKLTCLLITSIFTGLFVGNLATTSFAYTYTDVYVAKGNAGASKLCDGSKAMVEYAGKTYSCVKVKTIVERERSLNLAKAPIDEFELLPDRQSINAVGAGSKIEPLRCPFKESSTMGKYGCLAFRAPYMTLTFLFRPLPFIDTTSQSSTFAAVENTLWILMFILIFYRVSNVKRIPFFKELAPSMTFFLLYAVGAGSYEGNMGTAFRHKSLILWVPLLLLFALFWHKESQAKESGGIILRKARFN